MTDGETITLAFFREEFQISRAMARVLRTLWNARSKLSPAEVATRSCVGPSCVTFYICKLRDVLPDDAIPLNPTTGDPLYWLTSNAKAEIDRLLTSAAQQILATLKAA